MGGHAIHVLPTTRHGRWAARLALAYIVLVVAWAILPGGAAAGFVAGLAGGGLALEAIIRQRERALTVFAAALPVFLVVAFVLAELLIGHD